ncbi:hypothetical protein [Agromyces allii]|uniref:hypothetical protein n=1 Tax=Agromyces allii TaxID=393607 RepID=UPI0012FB8FC5|nr:hypothetical protein [Agromyces allii]
MTGLRYYQNAQLVVAQVRENARAAIADSSLQDIAHRAGLDVDELAAFLGGAISGDLFILSRLEHALGVSLWPEAVVLADTDRLTQCPEGGP